MKQMMWFTLAMLSFALNLGCERNASNKSRITLQLPQELQERIEASKVSSFTTLNLRHLALQISAPDINPPIRIILDSEGDDKILPASVEVEIPMGDKRLVQLVAAYANSADDSPLIYYGDIEQPFRKSVEYVDLKINKLGGAASSAMSDISGRFLTGVNQGPTGHIEMVYRPAGKPSMPVDKKPIMAGWFETSTFADVPIDYVITPTEGASILMGSQWTTASIETSNHLVRFSAADGFESIFSSGTEQFKAREGKNQFIGFFANDSSLLTNKNVCVTTSTVLNNGTMHAERSLKSASRFSARSFKHFAFGTTPTFGADYVTIAGGKTTSSCGSLDFGQEYKDFLWFQPNQGYGQSSYHDFSALMGLNEGFADSVSGDNMMASPLHYPALMGEYLGEMAYYLKVLPGIETVANKFRIYQNLNPANSGGDDRCDKIDSADWTLIETADATYFNGRLVVKSSRLPTASANYGICLEFKQKAFGRRVSIYNPPNLLSADQVGVGESSGLSPTVGECRRLSIYLKRGDNQNVYPATLPRLVYLNADIASTPTAVLYTDPDCTGTPVDQVNTSIPAYQMNTAVYYKATSDANLNFTASSPVLSSHTPITVSPSNPSGTLDKFLISADSDHSPNAGILNVFENGCFPLKATALDLGFGATNVSGAVALEVQTLTGAAYTPPAGFGFYDSCASSTPITQLNYSTSSKKSFVIKTSGVILSNKQIRVSQSSKEGIITFNLQSVAHKLEWSYPGLPGDLSLLTFQCVPVSLKLKNNAGQEIPASEDVPVEFANYASSFEIYASGGCSSAIQKTILPQGSSSVSLWVRNLSHGPYMFTAQSLIVSQSANLSTNTNPSTLIATANVPSAPPGTVVTITISGGSAPYSKLLISNMAPGSDTDVVRTGNTFQFQATLGASGGPASLSVSDFSGQTVVIPFTVTP